MKSLSETWFAEGYIDFELKKYTLLAYLKEINKYFNESKLYPQLSDIIFHFNNLIAFRENKKFLQEHFPKKLTGIQMEKLQILYEQMIEDDELMQELEDIINYSAGEMKGTINNGVEIYEMVEDKIIINPIGIIPLDTKAKPIHFECIYEREQYPEDVNEKDIELNAAPATRLHMRDFLAAIDKTIKNIATVTTAVTTLRRCCDWI